MSQVFAFVLPLFFDMFLILYVGERLRVLCWHYVFGGKSVDMLSSFHRLSDAMRASSASSTARAASLPSGNRNGGASWPAICNQAAAGGRRRACVFAFVLR